jgi:hypothetical protein
MRILTATALLFFICCNGWTADPPMQLKDEGVTKGVIFAIDCTGSGITCSKTGTTGTLNVSSGGSSQWTTVSGGVTIDGNVGIGTTAPGTSLVVVPSGAYTYGSGGNTISNYNAGGGVYYRVHKFTATGANTFVAPTGLAATTMQVLVVGGGGGAAGQNSSGYDGGAGGAGGFVYSSAYTLNAGASYTVSVGAGGAGGAGSVSSNPTTKGTSGSNSVFDLVTAIGGGGGGASGNHATVANDYGQNGGSGGGGGATASGATPTGGTGISGQGYAGGNGTGNNTGNAGGGGGCAGVGLTGTPGSVVGAGGAGCSNSITGAAVTYAAGGTSSAGATANGAANTGNGGTNRHLSTETGGSGGSGIVIVAYQIPSLTFSLPQASLVNGKVSIGKSTAATASLDVQGAGSGSSSVTFQASDVTGTATVTFLDSGSVGIGSFAPRATLEISGSMTISSDATFSGKIYQTKNATAIGHASCTGTSGAAGYCVSAVDASGLCTCTVF